MLKVHDIRETRVYQEAKEEGLKEGEEIGMEKGIEKERQRSVEKTLRAIANMAAKKIPAAEIASILEVDVELVHQALAGSERN